MPSNAATAAPAFEAEPLASFGGTRIGPLLQALPQSLPGVLDLSQRLALAGIQDHFSGWRRALVAGERAARAARRRGLFAEGVVAALQPAPPAVPLHVVEVEADEFVPGGGVRLEFRQLHRPRQP